MVSQILISILALSFFGRAEVQADALFNLIPSFYDKGSVQFDNEGSLWAVHAGKDALLLSKIDPRGRLTLDKLEVRKKGLEPIADGMLWVPPYSIVFDRWNNAWFNYFAGLQFDRSLLPPDYQRTHLVRVTPKGMIQDYHPWPGIEPDETYLGIMPGDTLLVVGRTQKREIRVAKGVIDDKGLTTVPETDREKNSPTFEVLIGYGDDLDVATPYWEKGYGLRAGFGKPEGKWKLFLSYFSLEPPYTEIEGKECNNWRDYIWRSYTDAWIGKVSISPYKDSGYVLCIPDPLDSATTHLLRINEDGTLIPPSELKDGGSRSARSFDRLPKSAEQKVKLELYVKHHKSGERETVYYGKAIARFWGVDLDGNLYYFSKSRNY